MHNPKVYLSPHTATESPAVRVGNVVHHISPDEALVWIKRLSDYLYCPALVQVTDQRATLYKESPSHEP